MIEVKEGDEVEVEKSSLDIFLSLVLSFRLSLIKSTALESDLRVNETNKQRTLPSCDRTTVTLARSVTSVGVVAAVPTVQSGQHKQRCPVLFIPVSSRSDFLVLALL